MHPYYPLLGLRRATLQGIERLSAGVNLLTDDQVRRIEIRMRRLGLGLGLDTPYRDKHALYRP